MIKYWQVCLFRTSWPSMELSIILNKWTAILVRLAILTIRSVGGSTEYCATCYMDDSTRCIAALVSMLMQCTLGTISTKITQYTRKLPINNNIT